MRLVRLSWPPVLNSNSMRHLAGRFVKNFEKFTGNEAGKALVAAGPKL